VAVSVAPLRGLVEPALEAGVSVRVIVPPGRSEHGYELTPADAASVRGAGVVVAVGAGLDEPVLRVARGVARVQDGKGPAIVRFDAAAGLGEVEGGHTHTDACVHVDGTDPHLWMDAELCLRLLDALEGVEGFDAAGLEAARERVRWADAEARALLSAHAGKGIVTDHAGFGRFAARYGVRVAAVLRPTHASEPVPEDLARAIEALRSGEAGAVFYEPQHGPGAARRVAEIAGVPLGMLDAVGTGDWAGLIVGNARAIDAALGGERVSAE
jgi:ABC-type Zn uptake system ZnuABC Zn-binding protein ZnuA